MIELVAYGSPAREALVAAIAGAKAGDPLAPVTVIVPWAAGGSTDQMARIVAGLPTQLGQSASAILKQRVQDMGTRYQRIALLVGEIDCVVQR